MSKSTEKFKIQRPRKRIYEMHHEDAPDTLNLQESDSLPSVPVTEAAVAAAAPEAIAAAISVEPVAQESLDKDANVQICEMHQVDLPVVVEELQEPSALLVVPVTETVMETVVPDAVADAVAAAVTVEPPEQVYVEKDEWLDELLKEDEPETGDLDQPVAEEVSAGSFEQVPEATDDPFQIAMATVYKYSALSAATGLIPVPLVDMAGFMAMQLMMLKKLCEIYNIPFDSQRSKSAIAILASGINSAYLAASTSKLIPFIGAFSIAAMPAVNGALSYAVGRVFIQHFASGGTFLDFDPAKVKGYFEEQFRAGKLRRSAKP